MTMNGPIAPKRRFRAVFLSDVHLGTRGSRADFLAEFLRDIECEQLYLVGDIVDGWRLKKTWYWDAQHDEVLRLILRHARARDDHCTGQDHARQDHSHASCDALPTEAEGDDGSVDGARQDEDGHDLG